MLLQQHSGTTSNRLYVRVVLFVSFFCHESKMIYLSAQHSTSNDDNAPVLEMYSGFGLAAESPKKLSHSDAPARTHVRVKIRVGTHSYRVHQRSCIRIRIRIRTRHTHARNPTTRATRSTSLQTHSHPVMSVSAVKSRVYPVSYTHLTLPTIYSV